MKKNVLVIEDNKEVSNMYELVLKRKFNVSKALNFNQIQSIESKEEICFILMDYNIVGVSFAEMLAYVQVSFPNAKILLITGEYDTEKILQAHPNCFVDVLKKPIMDIIQLAEKIENYQSINC